MVTLQEAIARLVHVQRTSSDGAVARTPPLPPIDTASPPRQRPPSLRAPSTPSSGPSPSAKPLHLTPGGSLSLACGSLVARPATPPPPTSSSSSATQRSIIVAAAPPLAQLCRDVLAAGPRLDGLLREPRQPALMRALLRALLDETAATGELSSVSLSDVCAAFRVRPAAARTPVHAHACYSSPSGREPSGRTAAVLGLRAASTRVQRVEPNSQEAFEENAVQAPLASAEDAEYLRQLCEAVLAEFEGDGAPLMAVPVAAVLGSCAQRLPAAPAALRMRVAAVMLRQLTLLPELRERQAQSWLHALSLDSSAAPRLRRVLCRACSALANSYISDFS